MAASAYDPKPEFDYQRQKAAQTVNAQVQQQKDALARRSAQLGGGVNGAMMKQTNMVDQQGAERLDQANEGINVAERGENRRVAEKQADQAFVAGESQKGRDFSQSERLGSQDFASSQQLAQQKYQTGERLGSQDFAMLSAKQQQEYQTRERLGAEQFTHRENYSAQSAAAKIAKADRELKKSAMDMQNSQFGQTLAQSQLEFKHQQSVDEFNKQLASKIQSFNQQNPGILGSIFGDALPGMGGGGGGGGGGVGGMFKTFSF